MNHYVLGFAFSSDLERVILIQKRKPDFQHGKLNGVGGKIEASDTSAENAMMREFSEETAVYIGAWTNFVTMTGPDWKCLCFFTILSNSVFDSAKTAEHEFIVRCKVNDLPAACMRNLHWLIPMALNWDQTCREVIYSA